MLEEALSAALTNIFIAGIPVVIYLFLQRKLGFAELMKRLGFQAQGLLLALPWFGLACAWTVYRALTVPIEELANAGSPLRPFVEAEPSAITVGCAFLYGVVQTGFCEELLFRGLIGGAIARRTTPWKATILQCIPFVLMHLPVIYFVPDQWALILIAPAVLGCVVGWLRIRSQSIWGPVLVHGGSNFALALWVLFANP